MDRLELAALLREHVRLDRPFRLRQDALRAATMLEAPAEVIIRWLPERRRQIVWIALAGLLLGVALTLLYVAFTGGDGVHCTHSPTGQRECWWNVALTAP